MKVSIELSTTEARRLSSLLHDFRLSLAVCDQSAAWRNVGNPSTLYSLDDIVLLEDVRCTLREAYEEATAPRFTSPYITTF